MSHLCSVRPVLARSAVGGLGNRKTGWAGVSRPGLFCALSLYRVPGQHVLRVGPINARPFEGSTFANQMAGLMSGLS